jgi:hypothetical protein
MSTPFTPRPEVPSRLIVACSLLGLVLAGCGGANPLDKKINSADQVSFSMWESKIESDLTPEQVADLKAALQEGRFHIMVAGQVHGSEAIESALMDTINGRQLREVIIQGLGWQLDRADAERATLEDSLKKNALMTTKPGDIESKQYLEDLHDRQVTRLAAATEDVRKVKERIAAETAVPAAK